MCEAAETCTGCATFGIIFVSVLVIIIILCCIEWITWGELSDWMDDWLSSWIDKLPRPKNKD